MLKLTGAQHLPREVRAAVVVRRPVGEVSERPGGRDDPVARILGRIGRSYVEEINAFAKAHEIPVVRFAKGAVKDVARPQCTMPNRRTGPAWGRYTHTGTGRTRWSSETTAPTRDRGCTGGGG
jgi:hypothetical protein